MFISSSGAETSNALTGTTVPLTTAFAHTMQEIMVKQGISTAQNTVMNLEFAVQNNEGVEYFQIEVYFGSARLAFTLDVEEVPTENH